MSPGSLLGIPLMIQDQVFRDTVVVIPAAVERSLWENLAAGGQFMVSVVVLVLLAAETVIAQRTRGLTG